MKKIKAFRKEAGLTQQELGEKIGVSYQTICMWERGITHPRYGKLVELCKLFGCTIGELLTEE